MNKDIPSTAIESPAAWLGAEMAARDDWVLPGRGVSNAWA